MLEKADRNELGIRRARVGSEKERRVGRGLPFGAALVN